MLQHLSARLQKAFPGQLAEVILFGSRASGTAHAGSDYDFLILTNRKLSASEEAHRAAVFFKLTWPVTAARICIFFLWLMQMACAVPNLFSGMPCKTG